MGSQVSIQAEAKLTAAEAKLRLSSIPAQVVFDYFNPYFLSDYIPEHDFYRLLQTYDLPIQSSEEAPGISAMYESLRVTQHRYKLRLSLAFLVLSYKREYKHPVAEDKLQAQAHYFFPFF